MQVIADARQALMKAKSNEEIRRYEAHAALAYWTAWHELPVTYPRADLPRVPEHWRTFGSRLSPLTRSPRLAVNPPNAMLNYLYAILESEARLAVSELGLDPGIGFLHSDTRTRDSLACDLMEPVRPQVDGFLLDWLFRGTLQRKWFFEQRDGNCRLTSEFAIHLSETSRIWRQALGPLAEWIAHTLWSTTSQPARTKAPATRLTQRRKREAKGIPTTAPVASIANPLILRRDCAPMVSRENPLEVPRVVRLIAYESVRHGFLTVCTSAVKNNALFSDLLKNNVTFYKTLLPPYAAVIHLGGAPTWVVRQWLAFLKRSTTGPTDEAPSKETVLLPAPLMEMIVKDLAKTGEEPESPEDAAIGLIEAAAEAAEAVDADMY
jgi:CRISPR associated protein Cas1